MAMSMSRMHYVVVVAIILHATHAGRSPHPMWQKFTSVPRSDVGRTAHCHTESKQECSWRCIRHNHLDTFSYQDGVCCLYYRRVDNSDWDDANATDTVDIRAFSRLDTGSCPTDFMGIGKGCYKFMTDTIASWDDANATCANLGASLFVTETEEERMSIDAYHAAHPTAALDCYYLTKSTVSDGKRSDCPNVGSTFVANNVDIEDVDECRNEACGRAGANTFNLQGTNCVIKKCTAGDLQLTTAANWDVYALSDECRHFTKILDVENNRVPSACHPRGSETFSTVEECMEWNTCDYSNLITFVTGDCDAFICGDLQDLQLVIPNEVDQRSVYARLGGFWTGLKKNSADGTYSITETGQVATYLPWLSIMGGGEDCVLASPPHHFQVISDLCSRPLKYICEYNGYSCP